MTFDLALCGRELGWVTYAYVEICEVFWTFFALFEHRHWFRYMVN